MSFNSSRVRLYEVNKEFAKCVPPDAVVLDAGAGEAPYKPLFAHAKYESADFQQANMNYAPVTYVCDLAKIPVENGRFDFVVFNQVMEHLPEPRSVLEELWRVLKPSGKMIYTGPLFYEEHMQPYDFYRYTQFGLRHLFTSTGFEIEQLDWMEGYFGTVAYQLNNVARYLPWRPSETKLGFAGYSLAAVLVLTKVACSGASILFHKIETRVKYKASGYPKNYVVIVRKK